MCLDSRKLDVLRLGPSIPCMVETGLPAMETSPSVSQQHASSLGCDPQLATLHCKCRRQHAMQQGLECRPCHKMTSGLRLEHKGHPFMLAVEGVHQALWKAARGVAETEWSTGPVRPTAGHSSYALPERTEGIRASNHMIVLFGTLDG